MFRYGLVGNTIIYGGVITFLGWTCYEVYNIGQDSTKIDEKLAEEIFKEDPMARKTTDKKQ